MSVISNPLFLGKRFIGRVFEALETRFVMSGDLARRYLCGYSLTKQ